MSTVPQNLTGGQVQLLPHQKAFVEAVLAPDGAHVLALNAPPGSGKTVTLAAAVEQLLSMMPKARVLILAPAALAEHFAARLQYVGAPAVLVDRYKFREFRNAVAHERVWPEGLIAVMSRDFAKQPDVLNSLTMGQWDLLVIDGIERFGEVGRYALPRIAMVSRKVVVAATAPLEAGRLFPGDEVSVVEWKPEGFVNATGQPLVRRSPLLKECRYILSLAEVSVAVHVEEICTTIEGAGLAEGSSIARRLRRQLSSSPAALEAGLQALTTSSDGPLWRGARSPEEADVVAANDSVLPSGSPVAGELTSMASVVLQELDSPGEDTKATELLRLIQELAGDDPASVRICVLTNHTPTLFYLGAVLEDTGLPIRLVHAASSFEERQRILEECDSVSGLLLAHSIAMKGYDAPEMTDLVLYEIPEAAEAAYVHVVRFNGLGRKRRLNVHVLIPENSPHPARMDGLRALLDGAA